MWEELAGALSGASSGLQNIVKLRQIAEDKRLAEIDSQIKLKNQQLAQDEAKRRAVAQAREFLQPGQTISPEQYQEFRSMGFHGGLEKDPTTGNIVLQKTPQQLKEERMLAEVDMRLAEEKRKQDATSAIMDDPTFGDKPWDEQQRLLFGATGKYDPTSPEEDLKFSAAVAAAQARAFAPPRVSPFADDNLNLRIYQTALAQASKELNDPLKPFPRPTKEQMETRIREIMNQLTAQISGGQPAAAISSNPSRFKIQSVP